MKKSCLHFTSIVFIGGSFLTRFNHIQNGIDVLFFFFSFLAKTYKYRLQQWQWFEIFKCIRKRCTNDSAIGCGSGTYDMKKSVAVTMTMNLTKATIIVAGGRVPVHCAKFCDGCSSSGGYTADVNFNSTSIFLLCPL